MKAPIFRKETNKDKNSVQINHKFYQFINIRVEAIEYQEQPATAIFLKNNTQSVKSMILQSSVAKTKNRNENLQSFTSTIGHEFRTPLSTCLMLLEHMLQMFLHDKQRTICDLVRKQLSFLLSLVNDVMDLKIIEEFGHVSKKLEKFKPSSLLNFILDIFEAQVKMQKCYLGIE